ncbi:MAG: NUDIX domain-containing protein [Nocardioides sp.]
MSGARAVAVVVRDGRVLVIERHLTGADPEDYVVLPGGSVEAGETFEEATLRELWEETTLVGRIGDQLLAGRHHGREARYFLIKDVIGEAELSGPELADHRPDDSFRLRWVAIDDLADLPLFPGHLRADLSRLLAPQVTGE